MGKGKDKSKDGPNPSSITNRDILQRLNFLYQASVLLNGLSPLHASPNDNGTSTPTMTSPDNNTSTAERDPPPGARVSLRKKQRRVVGFRELSRSYVETMKSVGQKTNVRMDPSVKRGICKRCSTPLVPGISATVRVKDSASHKHVIVYRCHTCHAERRIPAPPVLHLTPTMSEDSTEALPAGASTQLTVIPASTRDSARKRKKTGPRPRVPPHFTRDVGHIVFRGNEHLDKAQSLS